MPYAELDEWNSRTRAERCRSLLGRVRALIIQAPAGGVFHDASLSDVGDGTQMEMPVAQFYMDVRGHKYRLTIDEVR